MTSTSAATDSKEAADDTDANLPQKPSPTKTSVITYVSTFRNHIRRTLKDLAQLNKDRQKNNEDDQEMLLSLDYFLDDYFHRPKLLYLAGMSSEVSPEEDDEDGTHLKLFNIQHIPKTKNSAKTEDMMALMQQTFTANEKAHARNVLDHDDTQAFNLFFYNIQETSPGTLETTNTGLLATIVFSIVDSEDKPFLFVYYRITNPRPLNTRKDTGSLFDNLKGNMNGIGCSHLLLRIAQQYLCAYIENKESYTVYLFANKILERDHYSKLGFRNLGTVSKRSNNTAYSAASEGLKKCFDVEGGYNRSLFLQNIEIPLQRDTVSYHRLLNRQKKPRVEHLLHTSSRDEMERMIQVMENDTKGILHKLSEEKCSQYLRQYEEMGSPVDEPFRGMLQYLQLYSYAVRAHHTYV